MRDHNLPVNRRTVVKGTGAALTASGLGAVGTVGATSSEGTANEGQDDDDGDDGNGGEGDDGDVTTVAHRGFAGLYPENTVPAVEGSAKQGADMVEIDVMPCADGTVVVFHDDELTGREDGGLTDAEGVVWETDCETVLSAEVLGTDATVPTLRETLEALPAAVGVNIELKNPGSRDVVTSENLSGCELESQTELWRPFVERTLAVADEFEHEVLVSSFAEGALAATREVDDSVPIAYLFWDSIEDGLAITREYDAEAIHPPWNMIQDTPFFGDEYYLSGPFADVDLVDVAHEEGREVNVWTVGTWYQADRLQAAGVDGLILDYPGLVDTSADAV